VLHDGNKPSGDTKPGQPILIRGARQLLTLRGPRGPRRGADLRELGIVRNGALLICNGIVEQVGPTSRVENLIDARDAVEVNAVGRIVMPGFVDSHTHLAFPPAGSATGDPASGIRAALTASPRLLAARARTHLEAMARHGTTTVEAKTGCGGNQTVELKVLRALAALNAVPVDLLPTTLMSSLGRDVPDLQRTSKAMHAIGKLLPMLQRRGMAACADLEWDPDPSLYPVFIRYMEAARLLGLKRKVQDSHEKPTGSVLAAVENGALSIDHLVRHDPFEMGLLARGSTLVTLLPATMVYGDRRPAPARELVESGAAVALASNFNSQDSPVLSMQTVIWLACRYLRLTTEEAISAGTINGAYALGMTATAGYIDIDRQADLLVLNVGDYRELGHRLGSNAVHLTMKRGEFIYREGQVTPLTPTENGGLSENIA
jgi:imidazolonepropionase